MSIAAITANIAIRTIPSSGLSVFVSHAYAAQAHQMAARTRIPRSRPPQVGSAEIIVVTCVSPKTKTRSKKSSSGLTRSSCWEPSIMKEGIGSGGPRDPCEIDRRVPLWRAMGSAHLRPGRRHPLRLLVFLAVDRSLASAASATAGLRPDPRPRPPPQAPPPPPRSAPAPAAPQLLSGLAMLAAGAAWLLLLLVAPTNVNRCLLILLLAMGLAVPLAGASETRPVAARPEGSLVLARSSGRGSRAAALHQ